MRHVLLPGTISASARGMQNPAAMAPLIAPAGGTLCLASGPAGALTSAVDVPTIATAADHHLGAAAGTKKQPRRDWVVLIRSARPLMTNAAITAILPRHACPGTVWCTVPRRTWQFGLGTVLTANAAGLAASTPATSIQHCHRHPARPLAADARRQKHEAAGTIRDCG
jgi:hypothetical protein